jgi:transcription-repair coupling factor (superfamily II helicase)
VRKVATSARAKDVIPDAPQKILKKREAGASETAATHPLGLLAIHVLEQWRTAGPGGLVVICASEARAEQLGAILYAFEPRSQVMVLPRLDMLALADGNIPRETSGRRTSVLRRLAERPKNALLIGTPAALSRHVPDADRMLQCGRRVAVGQPFEDADMRAFLLGAGYSLDDRIELPGVALMLGQAIEVFPAGALMPVRIDHADGKISGIHHYSLEDQRDVVEIDAIVIDPVSELELPDAGAAEDAPAQVLTSVFHYLPSARLIAEHQVAARAGQWFEQIENITAGAPDEPATTAFMTHADWDERLARADTIAPQSLQAQAIDVFATAASSGKALRRFLAERLANQDRIVFAAATRRDLRAMDRRAGGASVLCSDWQAVRDAPAGQRVAITADLDRGFVDDARHLTVVTAVEVLGSRASHLTPMARAFRNHIGEQPIAPGDAVIHLDRGMAVLRGLTSVNAAGIPDAEMVRLEFADENAVLVPPWEMASIWRYSSDPSLVTLDDADGASWAKRRADAEADLSQTAALIAQLVEERSRRKAAKLDPPMADYEKFAAHFGYIPTADQASAIADVLADLASARVMDRLVCGDVGYGKTEVALRAAAAAVFSGRQVAVAVPTTVLARQHYETFVKRFAPFGIKVGQLSRFTSSAEARSVKTALADGTLSVVIGTHSLLGKSVSFDRLGLLIIDEEQHFGKDDKARLKELAGNVHLLTMTATPIPMTLNEAQAGLRAVSVISTPPVRRIAVRTVVEPYSESAMAAALRREHRRRGQSFVVCPRVEDIAPMQQRLADSVPELKTIVMHGKLPPAEIDAAMLDFSARRSDILLATNIIESGLDIPRANTMIVWRPDKFGLAQLHQLRGRVGRGSERAYALFLTDPDAVPSKTAMKRLETLEQFSQPGAGFAISARDMDLRGGGDPLSDRQSGHIQMLGPELSRHLLDRAVSLEASVTLATRRPELRLDLAALLPVPYIQDEAVRLQTYARIFKCETERALDEVEDEMEERFGDLPDEARNLLGLARAALDCARLGIVAVDAGPKLIAVTLDPAIDAARMKRLRSIDKLEWADGRLLYRRPSDPSDRFAAFGELVDMMTPSAHSN